MNSYIHNKTISALFLWAKISFLASRTSGTNTFWMLYIARSAHISYKLASPRNQKMFETYIVHFARNPINFCYNELLLKERHTIGNASVACGFLFSSATSNRLCMQSKLGYVDLVAMRNINYFTLGHLLVLTRNVCEKNWPRHLKNSRSDCWAI